MSAIRTGFLMFSLVLLVFPFSAMAVQDAPGPGVSAEDEQAAAEKKEAIEEISLEDLLAKEIAGGKTGSFGLRLGNYDVDPYVHAYTVVDYVDQQGGVSTFDLHYFNVFIGANINDRVIPELQLEYEHGGDEIQVRFGQLDLIVLKDVLTVRAGKFLVPMGIFNEYIYPEFISKLPERPFALREIVPVSWAEVGVQVRGKRQIGGGTVDYAAYIVNGLEQRDGGDGGGIRGFRSNHRDRFDSDKAVGGKIGYQPFSGFQVGASMYTGAYTRDGQANLSIYDLHLNLTRGKVTVQSEYAWADQERRGGPSLDKKGWYLLGAYRLVRPLEAVAQFDTIDLDGAPQGNRDRWTVGLNYYPFPKDVPSLVLKTAYSVIENEGVDVDDDALVVQLAIGF